MKRMTPFVCWLIVIAVPTAVLALWPSWYTLAGSIGWLVSFAVLVGAEIDRERVELEEATERIRMETALYEARREALRLSHWNPSKN